MSSTIAAIATPMSAGGIGIVRISGEEAQQIADKVFKGVKGIKLVDTQGYVAQYGKVYDGDTPIDEAIALVFKAPKSYTGENVVELSCHGGLYVMQRVLRAVFNAGATPAQAGEFTKRAFLNGKIDLAQAESVMGVISAQGQQGLQASLSLREGRLSKKIDEITNNLISSAAHMSAWVDYPEDDVPELDFSVLKEQFESARESLEQLLKTFDSTKAITQGVNTVIAGRPNVGKSTLMNLISGTKRSIVTDIAGTTRDVVEQTVRLGEVVMNLADTAGIRETDDPVESIGVDIAKKRIESAEFILAVFDASQTLDKEDKDLIELCRDRNVIAVINKTDLEKQLDTDYIESNFKNVVYISASSGDGYEKLSDCAAKILGTDKIDTTAAVITTERQRACCVKAVESINEALSAMDMGLTLDAINVCIDDAVSALLELTGKKAGEEIVNNVFHRFCVGK
ncbi:MAG: tRNA uridine-5-carboxymethylaminomethyl(34) synthesis GTPase MnmE [Clostridiales bacterium]|nr:tRNA uridine-5-carboxymethylaminomethyl(34) synthesis GTPase MnmE [Clostridiales bacterium]